MVYVNGVPVVRDNLPAGAITASTPASSFTSGTAESNWFEYQVPASLFTAGDNTIAVEVHQSDLNNADSIFDFELVARNGSEATAPSTPAPSVAAVDFSSATLTWPASTDDVAVIGYVVRRNGTPIAFTQSTSYVDDGLAPGTPYAYTVTAVDSSGNTSTPGAANTTTAANTALVRSGDVWSYNGTTTDPGTAWRQPGFDASSWPTGPSQLGWGGKGEATTVPVTGTQYYVRHFNVDDPSHYQQLLLRLVRDDGAAVYLNGVEVRRDNLPTGGLTYNTRSSGAMTAPAERNWFESTVPGSLLVAGDNVIAVEVHQDTATNGDSLFNLELVRQTPADTNPPTRPSLSLGAVTANSIGLSWTGSTDDAGILGYVVRRNGAIVGWTTQTSFTDTGLSAEHHVRLPGRRRRHLRQPVDARARSRPRRSPPRCSCRAATCGSSSRRRPTRAPPGASPASTPRRGRAARRSSAGAAAARRPRFPAASSRSSSSATSTCRTPVRSAS